MQPLRRGGFTLVELLIVVLVLGILATVGAGKLVDVSMDTQVASIRSSLTAMHDAIDMNSPGKPPPTIEGSWFRSGKLPTHPQNSFGVTALQIDNTANKLDPIAKVLKVGAPGAYWYNPATAMIRARVAAQATTEATLDLCLLRRICG